MKSVNVVVTASELRQKDGSIYKRGDVLAVSEQDAADLASIDFVRVTNVSPEDKRYSRRDMRAKR